MDFTFVYAITSAVLNSLFFKAPSPIRSGERLYTKCYPLIYISTTPSTIITKKSAYSPYLQIKSPFRNYFDYILFKTKSTYSELIILLNTAKFSNI